MSKRVIIVTFDENSVSYQAFSEIKKLQMSEKIKMEQMGVITHSADKNHTFEINDFVDFTGSSKASTDGLIGMVIGMFGGLLPMLLGWFAGGMIGSYRDAKELSDTSNVFQQVINDIPEGHTGVMLIANENDNRALNEIIFDQLGGHITRLDYEEVFQDVKNAQAQEKDAVEKQKAEGKTDAQLKGEN